MYTSEKNIQILISLMKAHGIYDIIISPGSMNHILAASVQDDPDFRVYSCIDERSAAYMACGISEEKGCPVAISCTGATASRDYMPGLTEAFYRKLPILAITSLSTRQYVGQLLGQQIDRSQQPKDLVVESVYIPPIKDDKDFLVCEREINKALLALSFNGGGPVHIDLGTYFGSIDVEKLPSARIIHRYTHRDLLPSMPKGRIAVMMGVHGFINDELEKAIDLFCATHDAIVITPNPRSYRGKYAVNACLLFSQLGYNGSLNKMDLMIHIGEVNTDAIGFMVKPKEVWRVNEDGLVKDRYDKLTAVFQMSELEFFNHYSEDSSNNDSQLREFEEEDNAIRKIIPELPFSNGWMMQRLAPIIPVESRLHLGILNSVRAFDYAKPQRRLLTYANTGGFGIDGCISSMVGASMASPKTEFYGVFGDLVFFYDMNVFGNRHVGNNLHIIIVNNDGGQQFRNFDHPASKLGKGADPFIAAAGHNGPKSSSLIKNYVEDLGLRYLSASNKEEFEKVLPSFLETGQSVVLETFTDKNDENEAFVRLRNIIPLEQSIKSKIKGAISNNLGVDKVSAIKTLIGKK